MMDVEIIPLETKADIASAFTLMKDVGLRIPTKFDCLIGAFQAEELIACGGYCGSVIQGLAVMEQKRGEGLLEKILSSLISILWQKGERNCFLFTTPKNREKILNVGFHL